MTTDVGDVRENFPSYAPHFWSRLTGKALPGQEPIYRGTWLTQVFYALSLFLGSMSLIVYICGAGGWLWLFVPVLMCFEVSGARYLTVVLHHQAVHHAFTGNKELDRLLGSSFSLVTMTQVFEEYEPDHMADHHGKKLATLEDPDLKFLLQLGFRIGESKAGLWRHLAKTLISPRFQVLFLKARLRSNFWGTFTCRCKTVHASWTRRAVSVGFALAVLTAVWSWSAWIPFLVAYVVPIALLYNVSSILQFLCEHRWARIKSPEESVKIHLARLTTGRFCGEPTPRCDSVSVESFIAWAVWYARMALIHFPSRAFVLMGDLPVHDFHHRDGHSKDWPDAVYARQRDIEAGCPGWPEPPMEVWGLKNAIDELFSFWSSLPQQRPTDEQIPVIPPEVFVPLPGTASIIDKLYAEGMKKHV